MQERQRRLCIYSRLCTRSAEQYAKEYEELLGEEFEPDDVLALGRGLDRLRIYVVQVKQ